MILAIDPGNVESAYCLIDVKTYKPIEIGKIDNYQMVKKIETLEYDAVVIEMIASYGMAVGKTVFDTCVWIGQFIANALFKDNQLKVQYVYRKDVKMNLCRSMRAKDNNITQALIDRFAPYTRNRGKGVKNAPGWFYGFKADIWQAYAVGVTYLDKNKNMRGKKC